MKILLVDDSKTMRMLIKRALREAGYGQDDLSEASNGEEALQLVRENCPDLLLSDWNMPGTSGIELLEALRGAGNNVRFGFITAESTVEMRMRASAAGAQFLLAKPFTVEELERALNQDSSGLRP